MRPLLLSLLALGLAAIVVAGVARQRRPSTGELPAPAKVVREAPRERPDTLLPRAGSRARPTPPERHGVVVARPPRAAGGARTRIVGYVRALEGYGVDAPSLPGAGVEVILSLGVFEELGRCTTDAEGRFEFDLELNEVSKRQQLFLTVEEGERYRRAREMIRAARGELHEIELRRVLKGDIEGVTLDPRGAVLPFVELGFDPQYYPEEPPRIASDAAGHFQLTPEQARKLRSARSPGHKLSTTRGGRRQPRGGYTKLEVILAPVGTLRLRVLDGEGRGVRGALVEIKRAGDSRSMTSRKRSHHGTSSVADGISEVVEVWAREPLQLKIFLQYSTLTATGVIGDELRFIPDPRAGAILVPAGGELELIARVGSKLEIRGVVRGPNGQPVSGARVRCAQSGRPAARAGEDHETSTNKKGAFQIRLRQAVLPSSLTLTAWTEVGVASKPPDLPVCAGTVIQPAEAVAGRLVVDLDLLPTLTIEGRGVPPDGYPNSFSLWAIPAGAPDLFATTRMSAAGGSNKRNGHFVLGPLEAGQYDVVVSLGSSGPNQIVHCFPSIAAGSKDVALRVPLEPEVRIQLAPAAESAQPARMVVLVDRVFPHAPDEYTARRDTSRRIDRAMSYPILGAREFQLGRPVQELSVSVKAGKVVRLKLELD